MARLCSLFSGSSGNSVLVTGGGAKILVDAGKNARTIENALKAVGEDVRCIDAILVTHEHSDHTTALDVLVRRYRIPVYANEATLRAFRPALGAVDESLLHVLPTGGTASVKDLRFESFPVPHDSVECVGYRIEAEGSAVSLFTDVGHVPDALLAKVSGSDLVFLEANHDVEQLKQSGNPAHKIHRTVVRPWGSYTTLEQGPGFKLKRIVVNPGAALSLQMHHRRSEHWVVVAGVAHVVNGEREFIVHANESTFIPAGHKHRLSNRHSEPLVIIEVQTGDFVEEDDIVRFDDVYGRS